MTDEKDMVIRVTDKYGDCLSDWTCMNPELKEIQRPKGFVEIFEVDKDTKKLIGKSNLVVYLGRQWLISSALRTPNTMITPTEEEFICWFGLGTGGCPIGDPLNPVAPTVNDTSLDNEIMINASDATCGDYRITPVTGYYKHPFDSVSFEQDADNYNTWLIARVATTIGPSDGNGYNLNEAGLFTAESSVGGYSGVDKFHLYARVTFPTIVKSSSRQLLFIWYLYF